MDKNGVLHQQIYGLLAGPANMGKYVATNS